MLAFGGGGYAGPIRGVKGHDTLENMPFSLNSSLDPIPVSRDAISGPERDQLPAPCWAQEEGPERRSTCVVKAPPDRVPPHLELFLSQFAVPVKCAIRIFSSNLPSWSRSRMWWPAFLRHAFPVLCRAPRSSLAATPGVSSILLPLRHAVMSSLCGPLVGSSSPRGGTRVPLYLVGDVVGV